MHIRTGRNTNSFSIKCPIKIHSCSKGCISSEGKKNQHKKTKKLCCFFLKKYIYFHRLHLNFWRQAPAKRSQRFAGRCISAFITCKPNQSCSYMKFTQGSSFLKRQFGSRRKENTTAVDSIMKEEGKWAPSPKTNTKQLGECWLPLPLPRVLCTPSASSFTDSSRRSRFCTSSATTCPSTFSHGEAKGERDTCHKIVLTSLLKEQRK